MDHQTDQLNFMIKSKKLKPIIITVILLSQLLISLNIIYAQDQKDRKITVGMEWEKADKILNEIQAKEQILEMMPPESPNGGYMKLKNFEIKENTVLTIIYDKNIIIEMGIYTDLNKPKAFRKYNKIKEIDLEKY